MWVAQKPLVVITSQIPEITREDAEGILGPAANESLKAFLVQCQGLGQDEAQERRERIGMLIATTMCLAEGGGIRGASLPDGPEGVVAFVAVSRREVGVLALSSTQHLQAREDLLDFVAERYGLVSQQSRCLPS